MAFANPEHILDTLKLSYGETVADLGCGAGYFTTAAADRVGDTGKVYAIDIQDELLTKARSLDAEKREHIEFIHGDLERPGGSHLSQSQVDTALLVNVLFQAEHADTVVSEAARILRPGGRLLIIDWTDSFGGMGPQQEHVVSSEHAEEYAKAAGLTCEPFSASGDHHWGLLCTKH